MSKVISLFRAAPENDASISDATIAYNHFFMNTCFLENYGASGVGAGRPANC